MKKCLFVLCFMTLSTVYADDEKPNCTLKVQVLDLESGKKRFEMKEFAVFSAKECKSLAKQHTTKTEKEVSTATASFHPHRH